MMPTRISYPTANCSPHTVCGGTETKGVAETAFTKYEYPDDLEHGGTRPFVFLSDIDPELIYYW